MPDYYCRQCGRLGQPQNFGYVNRAVILYCPCGVTSFHPKEPDTRTGKKSTLVGLPPRRDDDADAGA
jgi:hypothetical protein